MIEDDCLCISCYDNLKIAYNFKSTCVQSDILRRSQTIKIEKKPPEGKYLYSGKAALSHHLTLLNEISAKPSSLTESPSHVKNEAEIEIIDESAEDSASPSNSQQNEKSSDLECSECNEIFKTDALFAKHFDEMHGIETLDLDIADDVEFDDEEPIKHQSSPIKKQKRGRNTKYPEDGKIKALQI